MADRRKSWSNCSDSELCLMEQDHWDVGDFSIMTDSTVVWLSEQKVGHERTQHIEIPRTIFNRLVAAYLRNRKLVR